jgi:hypothetical protein
MKQSYSSCFAAQLISSSLYPKMRTVTFLAILGGADGDDPHRSIAMTAISVGGLGLGT